ncbi:MAG: hypothetical protein KDB88_06000 [Flavobacteriales bacterium]|nr:hypothetical protein [Flavobacteriales bacterium]
MELNVHPLLLLLIALLPAALVGATAYFTLKRLLDNERSKAVLRTRKLDRKHTLPLQLQAYERLVLFLERITPGPLVLRVHKSRMTAGMLHAQLVATIKEEYEHNVTQQIYVSDKSWAMVRRAKEETIRLVNMAFEGTRDGDAGTELSARIFQTAAQNAHQPAQEAILVIREEVKRLF